MGSEFDIFGKFGLRVGSEHRFLSFVFLHIGLPGFGLYPEKQTYELFVLRTHLNLPKVPNFEFDPTLSMIGSIPNKLILASIILITQSNFLH